ncbi:MAG: hypothetical protein M0005_10325 [Actinomycetota bacterium]|jgi:hypothetical protein|nr:hypothetical protein [Actinomycetota bacterium]
MSVIDELEHLLEEYDGTLTLRRASWCCWEVELRLTLTNPGDKASESVTFFAIEGSRTAASKKVLAGYDMWRVAGGKPLELKDTDEGRAHPEWLVEG